MCYVKVDRDTEMQRRIRLTSIAPIDNNNSNRRHDDNKAATADEALEQLLIDLAGIRLAANKMEVMINEIREQQQKQQQH